MFFPISFSCMSLLSNHLTLATQAGSVQLAGSATPCALLLKLQQAAACACSKIWLFGHLYIRKLKNFKKIMYTVLTAPIIALGSSFLPSAGFGTEEHTVLQLLCLSEMTLRKLINLVEEVQGVGHWKIWF